MSALPEPVELGDRYIWFVGEQEAIYVKVLRVAQDAAWADIECTTVLYAGDGEDRGTWTERQSTPFPGNFKRVAK